MSGPGSPRGGPAGADHGPSGAHGAAGAHRAPLGGPARVAVIGTGYVGLTTGAWLAHLGHQVCCADVVAERVEGLGRGEVPFVEEGLEALVGEGLASGRLRFVLGAGASVAGAAVGGAEVVMLCLPTPQGADGDADMSYVLSVAGEIGSLLDPGTVVVNKSTVPVGSARLVAAALGRSDVAVVSNPEFLREGCAIADCAHPDRIVIGADDRAAAARVAGLFEGVEAPVIVTDPESAELVKYAANAFLATKLSFVNAVANLCESVGADIGDVVRGIGYDHRIGGAYLRPGPGWGGSCFPKDTAALVRMGEAAGYDFDLLRRVIAVNEEQRARVLSKVTSMAGGSLTGVTVAVWGLTFKARTDDRRGSPAMAIVARLAAAGAVVRAYDPTVGAPLPDMVVCADAYSACEGASVVAVLTEWEELRDLDLCKAGSAMRSRCMVDARNLFEPSVVRAAGFRYVGTGRL
ncbi:MAG: UDP-glucose dehydrogenase family protein [Acidimicrobiales bacterium]